MIAAECAQDIDVTCLAVEMHADHRNRARTDRRPGRVRVDQPGPVEHIAQHRCGAGVGDGQGRRDERVGGHDHLVAGTDVVGPQHQRQRRRARRYPDTVVGPAVAREVRLEPLDLGAERERAGPEQPVKRLRQLIPDLLVLNVQRAEADARTHSYCR